MESTVKLLAVTGLLILAACGGGATLDGGNSGAGNSDGISIMAGTSVAIPILDNNTVAAQGSVRLTIDVHPSEGSIIETSQSGVVVYRAPDNFTGTDSFVYSLTDESGNVSVASINIHVACTDCTSYAGLRLSWPANAESDVESYRVFFGPDENPHTSTMLTEVRSSDLTDGTLNVVYHLRNDLNLDGTEGGCFRVTAVRGSEESEPSEPICFSLG